MVNLKRRSFLFGAAALGLIMPTRQIYLMPSVREVELVEGFNLENGLHWARRTVNVGGQEWHAITRAWSLSGKHSQDAALHVRERVRAIQPPVPWRQA